MSDLEEIIIENSESIEKPKAKRVLTDEQKEELRNRLKKGREKKALLAKTNNEIIDDVVKTEMIPKITIKKKAEIISKLKDESTKTPPPSPVKKYKKVKKIIEVVEESSDDEVVIERIVKKKPKKVEPIQEVPKIPRLIRL